MKQSNPIIRTSPESINATLKSCMKSDFTAEGCYLENLGFNNVRTRQGYQSDSPSISHLSPFLFNINYIMRINKLH